MSHTASPSSRRPRTWGTLGAGVAAVAACAVCCAGPLLALLGGIGAVSALASFWVPALAVVAGAAAVGAYVLHRRRRAATCDTATGPVDLGLPAVGPAWDKEHTH
ncbi:hypothetical protein OG321_00065 [Streptomyces sp. NBC_00424]|uniref:hypothetical protein n=1 Tax=Streptomyces sp. NBC_00424 TaxID=2903648 RepID=UPI002252F4EE|nr:hypothetical protein [Streptomyces sp. NBC_00424]MCX5070939.1 hypothetical protein [Streptomyces sp. NBC_00424]